MDKGRRGGCDRGLIYPWRIILWMRSPESKVVLHLDIPSFSLAAWSWRHCNRFCDGLVVIHKSLLSRCLFNMPASLLWSTSDVRRIASTFTHVNSLWYRGSAVIMSLRHCRMAASNRRPRQRFSTSCEPLLALISKHVELTNVLRSRSLSQRSYVWGSFFSGSDWKDALCNKWTCWHRSIAYNLCRDFFFYGKIRSLRVVLRKQRKWLGNKMISLRFLTKKIAGLQGKIWPTKFSEWISNTGGHPRVRCQHRNMHIIHSKKPTCVPELPQMYRCSVCTPR